MEIENGLIANARTQAELLRGFEVIARDQESQARLAATPRACGVCGAARMIWVVANSGDNRLLLWDPAP